MAALWQSLSKVVRQTIFSFSLERFPQKTQINLLVGLKSLDLTETMTKKTIRPFSVICSVIITLYITIRDLAEQ